jgi:predicted ATPase with chaperone activity
MLARRLPSILPRFAFEEALEVSNLYSNCGRLPPGEAASRSVPFVLPTTPSPTPASSAAAASTGPARSASRTTA